MKCSLCLFLALQLVWSQNDENCLTPDGEDGICVSENDCPGYTRTDNTNSNSNSCSNGATDAMVCCQVSEISLPTTINGYSGDVDSSSIKEAISTLENVTASAKQVVPESDTIAANNQVVRNSTESSVTESPTQSSASTDTSTTTSASKITEDDYESAFLEPPVCGETRAAFSRVVGGVDAKLGDFPWIGQIAYNVTGGFMFKCAGSLITSHHALTAAHCIYGKEDSIYFFRLGDLDTNDHNETTPVDAVVKVAIRHENYSKINYTNDIGILVFYRRVRFTEFIKPICLPVSSELRAKDFVGYNPFIAGWGRLKYKGSVPTRLQVLQLPVVTQEVCKAAYATLKVPIDQRDICAGGMGGKDACNGDSGGPLMQPIWDPVNYTTYFYQTGVVSLGVLCGTPGYPTVFTRVSEFIPWIQKIVLGK